MSEVSHSSNNKMARRFERAQKIAEEITRGGSQMNKKISGRRTTSRYSVLWNPGHLLARRMYMGSDGLNS